MQIEVHQLQGRRIQSLKMQNPRYAYVREFDHSTLTLAPIINVRKVHATYVFISLEANEIWEFLTSHMPRAMKTSKCRSTMENWNPILQLGSQA